MKAVSIYTIMVDEGRYGEGVENVLQTTASSSTTDSAAAVSMCGAASVFTTAHLCMFSEDLSIRRWSWSCSDTNNSKCSSMIMPGHIQHVQHRTSYNNKASM